MMQEFFSKHISIKDKSKAHLIKGHRSISRTIEECQNICYFEVQNRLPICTLFYYLQLLSIKNYFNLIVFNKLKTVLIHFLMKKFAKHLVDFHLELRQTEDNRLTLCKHK